MAKKQKKKGRTLYPPLPILIVDDEKPVLDSMEFLLGTYGFNNIILCGRSTDVMEILSKKKIGLVLLDLMMPGLSGEKLLTMITEKYPGIPVIIITGLNEVETAIRCIKSKAYDYLVKPINEKQLMACIKRSLDYQEMRMEIFSLKKRVFSEEIEFPDAFEDIVTQNKRMFSIFRYIEVVSQSTQPLLIFGETGVGKELIARAVHNCSERDGEFVALSISGLEETIFSDTLFGHVRGAFTGADKPRMGMVQKAVDGTLFLDEIGDLSMDCQIKLLRLIQEREFFPVGSDMPIISNVRILAATNRNLKKLKDEGSFRSDLYYRLYSHHVHVPPLRERMEDIPLLVDFFLDEASEEFGKKKPTVPYELYPLLSTYHFPGNIRELKALVFDAAANHQSHMLNLDVFKEYIEQNRPGEKKQVKNFREKDVPSISSWKQLPTVKQITSILVDEALKRTGGNKSTASRMLGISRQTLVRYLNRETRNS